MNSAIYKIGDLTLDVREIACISERQGLSGHSCCVNIWLKGGGKIVPVIEGVGKEERNNYDGPTTKQLRDRADKEINDLLEFWKSVNAGLNLSK